MPLAKDSLGKAKKGFMLWNCAYEGMLPLFKGIRACAAPAGKIREGLTRIHNQFYSIPNNDVYDKSFGLFPCELGVNPL